MGEKRRREVRALMTETGLPYTAAARELARRRQIPQPDQARYGHMPEQAYWEMVAGEDPDDRAIREAHGFSYDDDYDDRALLCRNGCGETYFNIATGKIRECAARGNACCGDGGRNTGASPAGSLRA